MAGNKNAYRVLLEKPERKRPLLRPSQRERRIISEWI
jgi:hypothetical protein